MSIRILLVTVFTAALMLTVRVADLWQGLSVAFQAVSVGSRAAAADPAKPDAAAPSAAPESADAAAALPAPPFADSAIPGEPGKSDAAPAVEGEAKAASRHADEDTFSDAELNTLQALAKRREELDTREKMLDTREGMLAAGQKRVDEKVVEMKDLQGQIKGLLKTYDEQENAKMKSLVKIYENMKPKDAAPIFEQLDMDILLDVVERMKEAKVAPILAQMNPAKAKEITGELARRHELSQTAGAGGT
ncbi:MAG TPA: hypothetical protein VI732_06150 [Alphaproteobacteria bacterium]|nr:hypothetical protein [Alphaproteobacteria bacterium]